jgi:hypothetical protein
MHFRATLFMFILNLDVQLIGFLECIQIDIGHIWSFLLIYLYAKNSKSAITAPTRNVGCP